MSGNVVILGGGTGGVVAASRLRRELESSNWAGRVVLVDRDLSYRFAPSFLWVMSGARRPEQVTVDLRQLRRKGVELLQAEVLEIDSAGKMVKTTAGALDYERLVIALGADLAPEALPGFSEAAHNIYKLEGAVEAGQDLREFEAGRVVVLVSRLPYKCPAAPYEAALLADALLRRRGVRERASIDVYTPEPYPMPTAGPVMGQALSSMLEERGIGFHPERTVELLEPGSGELVLTDGQRVGYDLLLGVPPHHPPAVVRRSGLAAESGFLPVDPHSLEAEAEGVFGIGDVTQIPIAGGKYLPRAGVFAHGQAEVVTRRIADELAGRRPSAAFDGKGACFVEMGDGLAAYATGNFYAEGGPQVRLRRPGKRWHLAKAAFEQYWMRRWFRGRR
ncbi:MAG TPA: FAD/NAD(P)-binding oxidoreductase [Acidimicrobiia bacterium]